MDMKVDTQFGGRGVYWNVPDGHQWEMLTVSYARAAPPGGLKLRAARRRACAPRWCRRGWPGSPSVGSFSKYFGRGSITASRAAS